MVEQPDDSQVFQQQLGKDERLLWTGRPEKGPLIYPWDIARIVLGLLCAVLFLRIPLDLFRTFQHAGHSGAPALLDYLPLLAIPYAVVVIGVVGLGGVIKRARIIRSARYAVTNRRIIFAGPRSGSFDEMSINDISALTVRHGADGVGTVFLGDVQNSLANSARYTVDISSRMMPDVRYLFEIPDAAKVHTILNGHIVRTDAATPPTNVAPVEEFHPAAKETFSFESSPPRGVHPAMGILAVIGNSRFQFGFFYIGVVMIFARTMLPGCDPLPIVSKFTGMEKTTGTVTHVRTAGSNDEGLPHRTYTYRFTDSKGNLCIGTFKSIGGEYEIGARVDIEYSRLLPSVSRIADMEPSTSLLAGGIVLFFIFIAIWTLWIGLVDSARQLYLLRQGEATVGRLTSQVVHVRRGDSEEPCTYSYDLTYAFPARDGRKHDVRNAPKAGFRSAERVEQPKRAAVLYDPANPDSAILISDIPGCPMFDRPGSTYSGKPWSIIGFMIIPALAVGGHALWIYLSR